LLRRAVVLLARHTPRFALSFSPDGSLVLKNNTDPSASLSYLKTSGEEFPLHPHRLGQSVHGLIEPRSIGITRAVRFAPMVDCATNHVGSPVAYLASRQANDRISGQPWPTRLDTILVPALSGLGLGFRETWSHRRSAGYHSLKQEAARAPSSEIYGGMQPSGTTDRWARR